MTKLPESYDTAAIEKKWQAHWLAQKTYAWDETVAREDSYVIDTPPPTVSGVLHMGHVFSYTQADFVARYQRMTGKNVFYPMGFDDNGLPTERLVEKTIKKRATDMSREEFIAECLKVSEEARKEFRTFFDSIALSVDWAQEYHTISESSRRLSQLSFLDLVNKGHVYRELKPFYWDPVDQTAIAQAEIVDKEIASFQNIILFTIDGKPAPVMTTRPELIPACVALMCHPDDAAKYRGKKAVTPLFGIEVPIIPDEKVDKEKGTGLVMCCTFGDDTDVQWWAKHKLDTHLVLSNYGKLNFYLYHSTNTEQLSLKDFPEERIEAFNESELRQYNIAYIENQNHYLEESWALNSQTSSNFRQAFKTISKIDTKKAFNNDPKHPGAREIIIALLKENGLLTESKPVTHTVKTAERSGAPLEILPSHQWFVRLLDKKEALKAKSKVCNWNPDWMRVRMEQWIDGLNQDWCISRQRYFGVPFPVWYVKRKGAQEFETIYADPQQLPVNPLMDFPKNCGFTLVRQEAVNLFTATDNKTGEEVVVHGNPDVMDTWATSSISPQLSAHGINAETAADKARFNNLYPADLRPQAHEIIRTWAFYTLVKAHLHNDQIPWKNLMISGWCLAEDKSKMSKSKGNVVTPVALIEEKGTDAVRYWAGTSRLGQDTAFSPDLLKIGRKLVTKLWNATQFAAIHLNKLEAKPSQARGDNQIGEALDVWILSRLGETVKKASEAFAAYEYADALDATNQFFWADFCDNYLELIKKRVYNEDGSFSAEAQQSAVRALYYCLETILKLYAPFIPHVTEELYSHIFADEYAQKKSIHARHQWPDETHYPNDLIAMTMGDAAVSILEVVRKAKSDANKSVKWPVDSLVARKPDGIAAQQLASLSEDLKGAGNIRALEWGGNETSVKLAAEADAA